MMELRHDYCSQRLISKRLDMTSSLSAVQKESGGSGGNGDSGVKIK